jgi:hypothetical protein
MNAPAESLIQKIIALHEGIVSAMHRSVSDAIEIGRLLEEKKKDLGHGAFLPWIEHELPFSETTAQRYMQVFRWKDKTRSVRDLSEAYRVAQIEDQRSKGREPLPKPEPKKPQGRTIDDQEYERRKEEAIGSKDEAKPDVDELLGKVEDMFTRKESEKIFNNFDLGQLIEELRGRILQIPNISRRHEVINKIIRSMKELAIECDRLSIQS